MIYLYSDLIGRAGGIETYLHALAIKLLEEKIPFRIAISEREKCPLVDELVELGVDVYRQRRIPGDTWCVRQRFLMHWLKRQLEPGDWVFCVRQPMPELYLSLVRKVHARGARIAASWMLAPEFLKHVGAYNNNFRQAVRETDAVISVSNSTVNQFKEVYAYDGKVHVVPYHNLPLFDSVIPLPPGPPWHIGYMGRLDIKQKNLDKLFQAFQKISEKYDVLLHLYGHGPDVNTLKQLSKELGIESSIWFHGAYDHRIDLVSIIGNCHFFVYPSRYEGGPCFTLLELMQAGRFVVAANVGGIPDLYANNPEAGILVSSGNPDFIAEGMEKALVKIQDEGVQGQLIRDFYDKHFSMDKAHEAWLNALGMTE